MRGAFMGWGCGPGWREWSGAGRGWGHDPNFMGWLWGAPGAGRRRGGFRGGRMFEHGDLKYVILRMLEEKPRHGYDIIKELEERSGGSYSPSPGTVYPTLTMLEDMGYARARAEGTEGEGSKRIYEITDAGRAHLAENKSQVEDIFDRISELGSALFSSPMMEVNHAFKDLARATYGTATRFGRDAEKLAKIRDALSKAMKEIDDVGK